MRVILDGQDQPEGCVMLVNDRNDHNVEVEMGTLSWCGIPFAASRSAAYSHFLRVRGEREAASGIRVRCPPP